MNRRALGESLSDYIDTLEQFKKWIAGGKGSFLEKEFARANEIRSRIP